MGADPWAVLAVTAFWLWVVSFLMALFKAFPVKGEFSPSEAKKWGLMILVTGAAWIVGLLTSA